MGYFRGFVHGAVVGTAVGLCVAPQPGRKTRAQLSGLAAAARDGYDLAQRTVRKVAPYAASAATAAKEKVDRSRRHENGNGIVEIDGNVSVDTGWPPGSNR